MIKIMIAFLLTALFVGETQVQNDELTKSIARGKVIYTDFCITCHKPTGEGTPKFFPPLAKSDFLVKNRTESIKSAKFGQKGKIVVNGIDYNGLMPNPGLTDEEVVDVMNYVLNSWGNSSDNIVTLEEVKAIK